MFLPVVQVGSRAHRCCGCFKAGVFSSCCSEWEPSGGWCRLAAIRLVPRILWWGANDPTSALPASRSLERAGVQACHGAGLTSNPPLLCREQLLVRILLRVSL